MKTKIIYISGNEAFDMADIRAAFEEVRNTLGLGRDTVMFGVPVDDDVFSDVNTNCKDEHKEKTQNVQEECNIKETKILESAPEQISETESEKENQISENIKKTSRKTVNKKSHATAKENIAADNVTENNEQSEKIIPILSILAAQKESQAEELNSVATAEDEVITDENKAQNDTHNINIQTEDDDINNDTIADMVTDEAPEEPIEKTLEQLLESMTPLREDTTEEHTYDASDEADNSFIDEEKQSVIEDETDATLEQLAAEFAENEDKIPTQQKIEAHSKIGKLKNILPFKKAKRDDAGLMGDLFGWAGIAANDDDFSIPGFFTNAAQKK